MLYDDDGDADVDLVEEEKTNWNDTKRINNKKRKKRMYIFKRELVRQKAFVLFVFVLSRLFVNNNDEC